VMRSPSIMTETSRSGGAPVMPMTVECWNTSDCAWSHGRPRAIQAAAVRERNFHQRRGAIYFFSTFKLIVATLRESKTLMVLLPLVRPPKSAFTW